MNIRSYPNFILRSIIRDIQKSYPNAKLHFVHIKTAPRHKYIKKVDTFYCDYNVSLS